MKRLQGLRPVTKPNQSWAVLWACTKDRPQLIWSLVSIYLQLISDEAVTDRCFITDWSPFGCKVVSMHVQLIRHWVCRSHRPICIICHSHRRFSRHWPIPVQLQSVTKDLLTSHHYRSLSKSCKTITVSVVNSCWKVADQSLRPCKTYRWLIGNHILISNMSISWLYRSQWPPVSRNWNQLQCLCNLSFRLFNLPSLLPSFVDKLKCHKLRQT